ncbi:MAG: restriction endonuclease subunit S [Verrucomicrobiota bacterium]
MTKRPLTSLRGKIHVKHGFPFKGEHFKSSGRYVVLTPGNFYEEGGFKRNASKDKCYSESFPREYLLKQRDILVAMTEQTDGLLGSMAKIPENDQFLHNQRLGLVTALTSDVDIDFVYHLFKTKWVRKQIRRSASGSKVKHTSPERIYDVQVQLPSLSEQKAIGKLLSAIDSKIEINRRVNEELQAMAKLLYDYWFVQFDFPISASQAGAMGKPKLNGKPYRTSGGKMVYNEVLKREIPEAWASGSLEQLGAIVGGSTPSTERAEYFCKRGTPWITPKDLSENTGNRFIAHGALDVTNEGFQSASLQLLPTGSVLMSSRAPIGYLAVSRNPVTTNQGFKSFAPNKGYSSDYIYFTLQHFMKLIKANASGSTFKEISGGTLKTVKIHLPPVDLVSDFTARVSCLSSQQSTLELQNEHLANLHDWLLPMLMNGQVTVA